MSRINVTTQANECDCTTPSLAGWFNPDRAETFPEATRWDGSEHVSVNHGVGLRGHQILYRTASGRWILHTWSEWNNQPNKSDYVFITDESAQEWLMINGRDDAVTKIFGAVEDERGPGRPEVGNLVTVRLGRLLPVVDSYANRFGATRAEAVRALIARGVGSLS